MTYASVTSNASITSLHHADRATHRPGLPAGLRLLAAEPQVDHVLARAGSQDPAHVLPVRQQRHPQLAQHAQGQEPHRRGQGAVHQVSVE